MMRAVELFKFFINVIYAIALLSSSYLVAQLDSASAQNPFINTYNLSRVNMSSTIGYGDRQTR